MTARAACDGLPNDESIATMYNDAPIKKLPMNSTGLHGMLVESLASVQPQPLLTFDQTRRPPPRLRRFQ
jgi:hypothetical protein